MKRRTAMQGRFIIRICPNSGGHAVRRKPEVIERALMLARSVGAKLFIRSKVSVRASATLPTTPG